MRSVIKGQGVLRARTMAAGAYDHEPARMGYHDRSWDQPRHVHLLWVLGKVPAASPSLRAGPSARLYLIRQRAIRSVLRNSLRADDRWPRLSVNPWRMDHRRNVAVAGFLSQNKDATQF